jgi:aminocarboxymuconate-semialdehyde decarboxylase
MAIKIDCDSHFLPYDAFDDVDPSLSDRAPQFVSGSSGRSAVVYQARTDRILPFMWDYPSCFRMDIRQTPGVSNADARAEDLAKIGFDRQVLVPNNGPFGYDVDPRLGASVCRSYNRAVSRVLHKHPDKFIGLAALPMQDVHRAIEELEIAVRDLGLHAPQIQTNILDQNLDEKLFWPFYQRVEELGVPLIVHSSHLSVTGGAHRYKRYRFGNALQFPAEASLAIGSLICGGALDAFPDLRVAFLEAGAGFLPYLFDRLNEVAVEEPQYTRISIKKMPTDYLDQLWFSFNIKTEAESIPFLIRRIGADHLLLSSDYPHALAGSGIGTIQFLESLETVSSEDKEKLMGLNAVRLFRLEV